MDPCLFLAERIPVQAHLIALDLDLLLVGTGGPLRLREGCFRDDGKAGKGRFKLIFLQHLQKFVVTPDLIRWKWNEFLTKFFVAP